jgi:hypothetical protein
VGTIYTFMRWIDYLIGFRNYLQNNRGIRGFKKTVVTESSSSVGTPVMEFTFAAIKADAATNLDR